MESVLKLFDGYSRKARLYPALLCLAPLVCTVVLLRDGLLGSLAAEGIVVLTVSLGGTYLLANLARSRGKVLEGALTKLWGGWPTTILLRHSDKTIDPYTKARYHSALHELTGIDIPTTGNELLNAQDCDHRYRSMTTKLIEARKDAKFNLLHQENASYGFRRNLLGLKAAALALIGASIMVITALWMMGVDVSSGVAIKADLSTRWYLYTAFGINLFAAMMWLTFVNKPFVRQAGDEYAMALLRTLDAPTV